MVGKCWPVLLLLGVLHSLLGRCEMKRRLWKVSILVGTPFGLKIHSGELTNPLQFYLFGICVACLKWGRRAVWVPWLEAEQASLCLVPALKDDGSAGGEFIWSSLEQTMDQEGQQKLFIASLSSVPTARGGKGTVNPWAVTHARVSRCAGPAPFIVQCC